jgi:Family of unknown function (DUF5906)/Poxvirus D5 protein-like
MDFYRVATRETKAGMEVYPSFIVCQSSDLMIRGGAFYAIWDESRGLWSRDEYDVVRIIDASLYAKAEELRDAGIPSRVKSLNDLDSGKWTTFRRYCANIPDTFKQLDRTLAWANTPPRKEDHSSRRLPYDLEERPVPAYDKLMERLFSPQERQKLEWAVGAIIAGDAKNIQKFIVLYGEAGTGKSTFLRILEQLFDGYWTVFDARALTSQNAVFASESFKMNPLVAIQHDGDLSRIADNTVLSTIISHEPMVINEKYRALYTGNTDAFLFIGTNQSVRITDAKSGLIRRLIDVNPTGKTFPEAEYAALTAQVSFELGGIAHHCLQVYRSLGKAYYSGYRPTDMMVRTDIFFNFLIANFETFRERNGTTLKEAWNLYKAYCEESGFQRKMPLHRFRDELRNYFEKFDEKTRVDGIEVRSLFRGFRTERLIFLSPPDPEVPSVVMDESSSLLDEVLASCPAQYAKKDGTPLKKWSGVTTTLAELDTSRLHYVKPPGDHIVIDLDLKGEDGSKSLELNLMEASKFPATYAEYSQSGAGVHLHYVYAGDVSALSRVYDAGIEVKIFAGDSSLRRQLTKCNNVPVAVISSGLPLKEKRLISSDTIRSERALRNLILRNLHKEIHPGTKPSIDFIVKILDDAYASGLQYDVTDMRQRILAFANNSTNHAEYCIRKVMVMKFSSAQESRDAPAVESADERLVFYDVEVFPNLFVVCWKYAGEANVVRLINPKPEEIEALTKLRLVGFNNRRYDNHILYARMMGYSEEGLFRLSQRIVGGDRTAFFGEAYDLSWCDIWDVSSVKQPLKRFQIELGLYHSELGLPWDQPVDESSWERVADYCANDVLTEEQVFSSRRQDYTARQILADLSGLRINDTTQKHTARIIFGNDRNPQSEFRYTDLSTIFPGYSYDAGVSTYKDEIVGEGGYVYAEPGMYSAVTVLDVTSMHPASIILLDLFGPYTKNYSELKEARIAIKHRDYDTARRLLGGKLAPYLGSEDDATALAYALKIILNIVYGLTSASFDNPFRDIRNKDNIVAKRGALFMIDLKQAVQAQGFQVIHIKTDSIKIPEASLAIAEFVIRFGQDYGYDFETEVTYEKLCLVNDAVYIARTTLGQWTATGAQFAHPYVFKTLFSKEELTFDDYAETRSVTGTAALYLDNGDGNPHFVGRAGSFVPVLPGTGGGTLLRGNTETGVFHSAAASKGYSWREAATVKELGLQGDIDMSYFRKLADDAVAAISKFGDFEWFTS